LDSIEWRLISAEFEVITDGVFVGDKCVICRRVKRSITTIIKLSASKFETGTSERCFRDSFRPLKNLDREFESHSKHGCLCARPSDGLISSQRSPTA
jgi:hypothetical protein